MPNLSLKNDRLFPLLALYGKLRRVFKPRPLPAGDAVRLHLGCGRIDHPGFVNIDGIDFPHVHYVQSLTRLGRFRDGSVSLIYVSHALEHFPREETVPVLKEWHRALAKGGKLCVSVPDFDCIVAMYEHSGKDADEIQPALFGGQDYPFNFHYRSFNQQSLTKALKEAGFASVATWRHGSDALHNLPDWSGKTIDVNGRQMPISLNLEATK